MAERHQRHRAEIQLALGDIRRHAPMKNRRNRTTDRKYHAVWVPNTPIDAQNCSALSSDSISKYTIHAFPEVEFDSRGHPLAAAAAEITEREFDLSTMPDIRAMSAHAVVIFWWICKCLDVFFTLMLKFT